MAPEQTPSGFQSFFESYVSVWHDLFIKPLDFFEEVAKAPKFQRVVPFVVVNFVAAGLLAWLGVRRPEIIVGLPLALVLATIFNSAVYMVCFRTLGTEVEFGMLFRLSLVVFGSVAILVGIPFLAPLAKLIGIALFCIAFMAALKVSIGRAIWLALSPVAFVLVVAVYLLVMHQLTMPWLRAFYPFLKFH